MKKIILSIVAAIAAIGVVGVFVLKNREWEGRKDGKIQIGKGQ